jgi:putative transposase
MDERANKNYQRDYSFKTEQQVSIITLQGRIVVPDAGYNKHLDLIANGAKIGAAKIVYQRSAKIYYLMVSIEVETPEIDPLNITRVSGVDVGMRYLAVETDLKNKSKFYSGKEARHKANRYHKARITLQRKGTRSAKRRLIALSGRERRFIVDVKHQISKDIAKPNPLMCRAVKPKLKSSLGSQNCGGVQTQAHTVAVLRSVLGS